RCDRQLSRGLAAGAYSLESVDDQVQDHLLQLDTVSLDQWQTVGEVRPHRDASLHGLATGQLDDLADRGIDVHKFLRRRGLGDERPDPAVEPPRRIAGTDE